MCTIEPLRDIQARHHHEDFIIIKPIFCTICYPPKPLDQLTTQFRNFWDWISIYCSATSYTSYTTVTFNLYINIYPSEPIQENSVSYRVTDFTYRIIGSLLYTNPTVDYKALVYYLINLAPKTNYFRRPVGIREFYHLQDLIDLADRRPELQEVFEEHYNELVLSNRSRTSTNMEADALKELLTTLLGPQGLNIARTQPARELSLVKVEPFYGRDAEDPFEWMDHFQQAARANSWQDARLPEICAGFLRDSARDWYLANKDNLNQWGDWDEEIEATDTEDAYTIPHPGFATQFLTQFIPEVKQNQWYHELMTIKQFADEKVEEYGRRFKKLLRKVNGADTVVPEILQVRMFLFGLKGDLTPLVATDNPTTLERAIERARVVETGYNYVPSKQASFQTTTATRDNPTIADIVSKATTTPTTVPDVDALADKFQQLTLANLASALLAKSPNADGNNNSSPRNQSRDIRNRSSRGPIICYRCNQPGHISRDCNQRTNVPRDRPARGRNVRFQNPRNTRGVNYIGNYYTYDDNDDDYEYEVYTNGPPESESGWESRLRKRVRSGDEMDDSYELIPPPIIPTTPETSDAETSKPKVNKKKAVNPKPKNQPKFRMKPAPIETVSEFDIAQYISNLPCGLSIGQASANIPRYRSGLLKSLRRKKEKLGTTEAKYAGSDTDTTTTAARCMLQIEDTPVEAIIDSGAAASIMTKKLAKKLGYPIDEPSNLIIVTANGTKVRSLGVISDLPIEIGPFDAPISVQVLDSADEVFILGNDWLQRHSATLSWETNTLTLKVGRKKVKLPVSCTRVRKSIQETEETEESSSEEDYEEEELYETALYFSDRSETEELEFNPWTDHQVNYEETMEEEIVSEEETINPAVFLSEVAKNEEKKQLNLGPLTDHQQELFNQLMVDFKDICADGQTGIGRTNVITHKINTGDANPIALPPYRLNPIKKEFLRKEIANMEDAGIVQKSKSPWAFPVVIVDKKDGTYRLCVDYRKLNKVTKPDAFPLPRIDDILESFGKSKWFTTLDLASGYWQVGMHPDDVEKTAFITPFGLYEFLVMPFGLSYAPGTFQRLMNHVLQDFLDLFVAVYLDDVIIYTDGSFEQHMDHLRQVFQKIEAANLKIKLKKCYFCLPNIHFLGHVVGRDGIRPDPEKIEKVRDYPIPQNLTQLRAALGLFSYYRKFVKDFSKIAKPLNLLMKKDAPFNWTQKQQNAFDRLKECLIKAPVLTYPEFSRPFIIFTDASGIGLGAVLSQKGEDGREHVIAYASRSLNKAEQNYSVTEQECLAVVWAIKHFQHYLGMKPFELVTDHSALKWLQTAKMPTGRRARWIMELQQYDFNIKHRPGKQNANADALSRIPETEIFLLGIDYEVVKRRRLSEDPNGPIRVTILIPDEDFDSEEESEADVEDNLEEDDDDNSSVIYIEEETMISSDHATDPPSDHYVLFECCRQTVCFCHFETRRENSPAWPAQDPSRFPCCGQVICDCELPDPINWDEYLQYYHQREYEQATGIPATVAVSEEETPVINVRLDDLAEDYLRKRNGWSDYTSDSSNGWNNYPDDSDENSARPTYEQDEEEIYETVAYTYSLKEINEIYRSQIKIKNVVANQPITRGGSKCTLFCDTENHHTHTYCTVCKRNLWYGTVFHDCEVGFAPGKKHPEMKPQYLVNAPWWTEPLTVQQHNNYIYLNFIQRQLVELPFYEQDISGSIEIAPLD